MPLDVNIKNSSRTLVREEGIRPINADGMVIGVAGLEEQLRNDDQNNTLVEPRMSNYLK